MTTCEVMFHRIRRVVRKMGTHVSEIYDPTNVTVQELRHIPQNLFIRLYNPQVEQLFQNLQLGFNHPYSL
jgi:hypothetical protein